MGLLDGELVVLRAVEPEDVDLMYLVENDTSLWHYGNSNVPYSRYALGRFIEQSSGDIYADGQLRLTVRTCQGVPVGFVDLQNFDHTHSRAEVGIVILPEMQGRGYASEALRLLSRYATAVLRLHLLYAVVSEDNDVACSLFSRSGFRLSCTLPEWLKASNGYANARLYVKILTQ